MKNLLFLITSSLIFFSCNESPETKFEKDGVSFICPQGWAITDQEDLDGNDRECVVEDIKLQKWNYVSLTLWNRSLDVIVDDKYSQSCAQDNSPDYSNSSTMSILGDDGFNGKVSNVYFYNYARKIKI